MRSSLVSRRFPDRLTDSPDRILLAPAVSVHWQGQTRGVWSHDAAFDFGSAARSRKKNGPEGPFLTGASLTATFLPYAPASLNNPSASSAASTAGRSATRCWNAANAVNADRSRPTCPAQLVTVNR